MNLPYAIAVDFDGCLCRAEYPEIGPPNKRVIRRLIRLRKHGCRLILWTCRTGKLLDEALRFCEEYGLEFDTINESLPERIDFFDADCRKVGVDEYWDDRSVRVRYGDVRLFSWFADRIRMRKIRRAM